MIGNHIPNIISECGGIIREGPGTLNLPGSLEKWDNEMDCSWTIRAPKDNAIQLTWISLPATSSSLTDECTRNYIELIEDYGSSDAKSLGR